MLNRFFTPTCVALGLLFTQVSISSAQTSATQASTQSSSAPREIVPFDAGWRFHLGDDPAAKQIKFDESAWRTVDLPHDWSIEGPLASPPEGEANGGFFYHGIGWYRKTFSLPDAASKKVILEFDGVYMNSEVWINGQFLGRRPYGFIGFRYDLTQYLKPAGAPNVIAVRVDDSMEPALRWYAGSGIYRHVRLIETNYAGFRLNGGIFITTPEVKPDQAVVQVSYVIDANFFTEADRLAWVKNSWGVKPVKRDCVLRSSVLAEDGTVVSSTDTTVSLQSMQHGQTAIQKVNVTNPKLWSDVTPALYQMRSTLLLDNQPLDETVTRFGIRKLEFDPDHGMLVNGKPTKLKGVCVHQDAGSFGNAVPTAVWAYRLGILKELGCNAIRPSHHPFAPEFYDLCDQMGFYVFDESFDEWTRDWNYDFTENPRGKSLYGYHLFFQQWHDTDLRDMLRRDRNHPCVVLYSIGNEIPNQLDSDGWMIAKELVTTCHQEDPTRPATSACDQSATSSRNGFMDQLDIMGYNYIDRLYPEKTYAPDHVRFPHRLMLGTEVSSALHNWLGVRDNEYVIGEFIWTGIDYLGESHALPNRGSGSGFVDFSGGKKPSFYQRAAYWQDEPIVGISVVGGPTPSRNRRGPATVAKWNWPAGSTQRVQVASNCDEVELMLNDQSLGRHSVSHDVYMTDWTVPFAPGTLTAIAYRAGKQVTTQKLATASAPAKLQITAVPSKGQSDIAFYEINVVDDAGNPVTDAASKITVHVEGPGKLIGLDSGDLSYGGNFKTDTRNAHSGRLLATVQRTAPDGEFHVTATIVESTKQSESQPATTMQSAAPAP